MRKLVIALVLLVVLNLGMAAGFASFLYRPVETPQTLRIAGALADGGYRLTLPGAFSSAQVADLKHTLDQALEAQQLEHVALATTALLLSSAPPSDTTVRWYVDSQQPCPLQPTELLPAAETAAETLSDGEAGGLPRYQWLPQACAPMPTSLSQRQQQRNSQTAFATARMRRVVEVLETLHMTDYRIEINGVMHARGGRWRVALPTGRPVSIDHRTLVSAGLGAGDRLWVLAPCTEQALRAAAVLEVLPERQALEMANAHEWRALWTWHDGRTMMSEKFSVQLLP